MRVTIDRKIYDTETAHEIASDGYSHSTDLNHWEETLYVTKKGSFFLHGRGGANSRYGQPCAVGVGSSCGGNKVIPMNKSEALNWCEKHDCQDAIEAHFADMVEEA